MARSTTKTTAARPAKAAVPPAANDAGELDLPALARAVLAREIRPRVAHVRRLAEAVLAKEEKRAKKKARKDDGKKRKLAKIPGQKAKK